MAAAYRLLGTLWTAPRGCSQVTPAVALRVVFKDTASSHTHTGSPKWNDVIRRGKERGRGKGKEGVGEELAYHRNMVNEMVTYLCENEDQERD